MDRKKGIIKRVLTCMLAVLITVTSTVSVSSIVYADNTTDPGEHLCANCGVAMIATDAHSFVCPDCDALETTEHTYEYTDNGDGTHTVSCTVCDYSETVPHAYVYTDNEDGTHTGTCACGATESAEHADEDKDGFCDVCDSDDLVLLNGNSNISLLADTEIESGTWLGMNYVVKDEDGTLVCYLSGEQDAAATATSSADTYYRKSPYHRTYTDRSVDKIVCSATLKNCYYLFAYTKSSIIDFTGADTSNVTNMSYMFYYAQLSSLDINNWDVSNVTNMRGMFWDARLSSLDINNWDVSNVTNMSNMFYDTQLSSLDLSSWDTSNVTNMSRMFGDSPITSLDLSNFNIGSSTNIVSMLSGCNKLHVIKTPCYNLKTIKLPAGGDYYELDDNTIGSTSYTSLPTSSITLVNIENHAFEESYTAQQITGSTVVGYKHNKTCPICGISETEYTFQLDLPFPDEDFIGIHFDDMLGSFAMFSVEGNNIDIDMNLGPKKVLDFTLSDGTSVHMDDAIWVPEGTMLQVDAFTMEGTQQYQINSADDIRLYGNAGISYNCQFPTTMVTVSGIQMTGPQCLYIKNSPLVFPYQITNKFDDERADDVVSGLSQASETVTINPYEGYTTTDATEFTVLNGNSNEWVINWTKVVAPVSPTEPSNPEPSDPDTNDPETPSEPDPEPTPEPKPEPEPESVDEPTPRPSVVTEEVIDDEVTEPEPESEPEVYFVEPTPTQPAEDDDDNVVERRDHNAAAIAVVSVAVGLTGGSAGYFFFVIFWRRRKLRGTIVCDDPECIRITLEGKDKLETYTDEHGEFKFTNLKEDNYMLRVYDVDEQVIFEADVYTKGKNLDEIFTILTDTSRERVFDLRRKTLFIDLTL